MRSIPLCLPLLLAVAACNPSNSLNGPESFKVQNAGAAIVYDGGTTTPAAVHIYVWGQVDGGGDPTTVCNEVTPTGPISSAQVGDLLAMNLQGGGLALTTGTYVVGADGGGPNTATVVLALGANGDQPNAEWYGTGGTISLDQLNDTLLSGSFNLTLLPLGGPQDAGSISGSFAAAPCTP